MPKNSQGIASANYWGKDKIGHDASLILSYDAKRFNLYGNEMLSLVSKTTLLLAVCGIPKNQT
jgi:hypothetical protein